MPRYFFHLHDGTRYRDADGVELAGPREAEHEAVVIAAEWLKDHPREFIDDGHMTVCMEDEAGLTLLFVEVNVRRSAGNRPAAPLHGPAARSG